MPEAIGFEPEQVDANEGAPATIPFPKTEIDAEATTEITGNVQKLIHTLQTTIDNPEAEDDVPALKEAA